MVIGSDPLRIIKRLILIKSNLLPNNQWNKTPKCSLNSLIVWIQLNLPSKLLIVSVTLHETFTRCKALCLILNKLYYCLLVHNIHLKKKKKMWIKSMFNICFSEQKKAHCLLSIQTYIRVNYKLKWLWRMWRGRFLNKKPNFNWDVLQDS